MHSSQKDIKIINQIESQSKLNLYSNIHSLKQFHSIKVVQVNNTLNSKPKIADSK